VKISVKGSADVITWDGMTSSDLGIQDPSAAAETILAWADRRTGSDTAAQVGGSVGATGAAGRAKGVG
jgi:hypothetical protein